MQYELSSEVEKVAAKVIKQHHPDLTHKKIYYLALDLIDEKTGVSKAKKSKGHQIAAEIKVVSGDAAFLISGETSTDDKGPLSVVVVKVYRNPWKFIKEEKTREAVLHSQLCRLDYDELTGKPTILEFDAKLMAANVAKYGAYNEDIERILKAAKDLPLFEENGKQKEEVKAVKANGNGKAVEEPAKPTSDLPPIQEQVNQKRGRTRAHRAGN
jgi:hypothetical protein